MMFKKGAIVLTLLAQPMAIWAANFGQTVAGTQGLGMVAQGADEDVQAMNLVTGATGASKIANDIQNLNSDIEGVQNRGAGTAPSGEDATEEQLTDAFDGFTDDFVIFLRDLKNKANVMNELGQGGAILTGLQDIKNTYGNYAAFLSGLLEDDDMKDAIDEATENGLSAITEAEDAY